MQELILKLHFDKYFLIVFIKFFSLPISNSSGLTIINKLFVEHVIALAQNVYISSFSFMTAKVRLISESYKYFRKRMIKSWTYI